MLYSLDQSALKKKCLLSGKKIVFGALLNQQKIQGHPMDLFLKISVLQAHFCWLGDVEEIIVPGRKVLLGKR